MTQLKKNNGQYLDYTGAAVLVYALLRAQFTLTVQEWENHLLWLYSVGTM